MHALSDDIDTESAGNGAADHGLSALLRLRLSEHRPDLGVHLLTASLAQAPEVRLCLEVSGDFDLVVLVTTDGMGAFNRLVDELLSAHPIVHRYETSFVKKDIKVDLTPSPGNEEPSRTGTRPAIPAYWVNCADGLLRIDAIDIDRITAERDYMRLHVGPRSWLLHRTIGQLVEELDPARFIRLHRSTIVRRDFIARLEHHASGGWTAHLRDGSVQRIARSHWAEMRALAGRAPVENRPTGD